MALLRSCRQVYSEAALMPVRVNTFAFEGVYDIKRAIKLLKTHQCKQIIHLQFDI